jgi:oxygen-independent coproporphyrinogen-3 oxidase
MKKIHLVTETGGAAVASSIPMPLNGEFSIYIHVPFCEKKCEYCHFYVIPDQQRFKKTYLQALYKEWEFRKDLLPQNHPISIYFGGGTPALLGPQAISSILSWIRPQAGCEITLEANPENVSLELMRDFFQCGVNRISMGVQSFDEMLLKTLSRTHTSQKAKKAVEETASAGFHNISIDLMYDLPDQTLKIWEQTLECAMALPVTHLSLYNLSIEPHTVFFKKKNSLKLPEIEASLAMLQCAVETFTKNRFRRYEISAFAKDGLYSKHNLGYWTNRPFLGFGPSAFSYWGGSRFRNIANLNRYAKALDLGEDPVDFKEKLSPKEKLKESMAVGLRLIEGIPLSHLPKEFEIGLCNLETLGLLIRQSNSVRLTERGLLLHDTVAEIIMDL